MLFASAGPPAAQPAATRQSKALATGLCPLGRPGASGRWPGLCWGMSEKGAGRSIRCPQPRADRGSRLRRCRVPDHRQCLGGADRRQGPDALHRQIPKLVPFGFPPQRVPEAADRRGVANLSQRIYDILIVEIIDIPLSQHSTQHLSIRARRALERSEHIMLEPQPVLALTASAQPVGDAVLDIAEPVEPCPQRLVLGPARIVQALVELAAAIWSHLTAPLTSVPRN